MEQLPLAGTFSAHQCAHASLCPGHQLPSAGAVASVAVNLSHVGSSHVGSRRVIGQYLVVLLLLTMTTFQNPSPGRIFTEALFSNRWTFLLCAHVGVFLSMGIGLWMSSVSPAMGPKVIFVAGSTVTCTLWIAGLLNQKFVQSEVFTAAIVVLLACTQPCILHGSLALMHKVPPWLHQRLLFILTTAPDMAMGPAAILSRRLVGDPRNITLMVSSAVVLSVVSGISMSRVRVQPRQPSSAMLETSHAVVFKHDAKGKVLIQLAHATFLLHLVMMTTKVHAAVIWSPLLVTTTVAADDVGATQALVDGLLPFSWILGSLWTQVAQSWPFFSTTVLLSIPVALLNLFAMWLPSRLTVVCSVVFYGAVRTVLFVVSARYIERRSHSSDVTQSLRSPLLTAGCFNRASFDRFQLLEFSISLFTSRLAHGTSPKIGLGFLFHNCRGWKSYGPGCCLSP